MEINRVLAESVIGIEEQINLYENALQVWQEFVKTNYPMSNNRPEDPDDYWNQVLNNTLSQRDADREIEIAEYYGGVRLNSTSYQACKRLKVLREIGIFPTPEKDAQFFTR